MFVGYANNVTGSEMLVKEKRLFFSLFFDGHMKCLDGIPET